MIKTVELCNEDLDSKVFEDVQFFKLAEGGAMGCPGEVVFYTKSGKKYCFNYVFENIDMRKVERYFEPLSKCRFGIGGIGSEEPKGWKYVNLGAGNHLLVVNELYDNFIKKIGPVKSLGEIYQKWMCVAEEILSNGLN